MPAAQERASPASRSVAGLLIDFSHSMRRIVGIGSDTVTVQPGVVLGQLNRYLAGFGRQFGRTPPRAA